MLRPWGDQPRDMPGARAADLESVELLALTLHRGLPEGPRNRLQLNADHANALLRITLRPLTGTLTDARANRTHDEIYLALHKGPVMELISR